MVSIFVWLISAAADKNILKKKAGFKAGFPDFLFIYFMNLINSALNFGSSSMNKA